MQPTASRAPSLRVPFTTGIERVHRVMRQRLSKIVACALLAACASTSSSIDRYVVFESHSFK
jgi:hypothetical protein